MNPLEFINQIKEMYNDQDPRPTALGPRNMYQDGQLVTPSVDGARPGYRGDKTQEVLKAYKEYKKSHYNSRHKYPIIPFTKFFEMYAKENFADGGSAGQLVTPSVDGSRPGYGRRTDYSSPTKKQKQIAEKVYGKDFHKLDTIKKYGIVHGHTTGRMNVSGSGGTPTTEQPSLIKKVEKILKQNIEKKGGANVFKITKGVTKDGYKKNGLIDKVIKGTDGKLKNLSNIKKLIDRITKENGWLTQQDYRKWAIVDSFMKDYGINDEFTGKGKFDERLKEFKLKSIEGHGNEFKEIHQTFKNWIKGDFEVEGYNRSKFDSHLKKNLNNWKPTVLTEKMIQLETELKWLNNVNTKYPDWTQERVEKAFNNKFKKNKYWNDTTFKNRSIDLYGTLVHGKTKNGRVIEGVNKGNRSKWVKNVMKEVKGGNYYRFLIAADKYEANGNIQSAKKLRNAAKDLFLKDEGIFYGLGQAEHPWFSNYGGTKGMLQIDSLVKGDLNSFKANNFEIPIRDLIKKYEAKGVGDLQKKRILNEINLRRNFLNSITDIGDGGMARNVTFDSTSTPGKIKIINKTPDIYQLHKTGKVDPLELQTRGTAYRDAVIKNLTKADYNILKKDQSLKIGKIGSERINKVLAGWCSQGKQRVGKDEGGRIGFSGDCSPEEKITNMKNAAAKLKQHDRYLRGLSDTTPFADNAAAKALASKMAKSGGLLRRVGRLAFGPMTLWGEPLFEGAFVAHDILGTGTPWKEAVAKSLWAKPAISMGLLKPADQQYEEALWQVRDEEGKALLKEDQTMAAPGAPMELRTRTGVKRFIDNNKKLDELNRLYKLKQTSHIMGPRYFTKEERAAKMKKADETYNNYLESLGGAEGVKEIERQIVKDQEAYDDRVAALEIERKGLTEKNIFSPSAQRAADIKQKQAEEDIMYQKYGKTRVKSAGIKGTPGEFKKQWIIDPKLKDSFFPEEVLDPNFMRTVLDLPTEESWSPNYPKTYRDFYPTPSSRYGWSQMGPVAQAGGISKLAGGGMVGIRKPHAIAPTRGPQSQGLASTPEYGTYNKEYKWQI